MRDLFKINRLKSSIEKLGYHYSVLDYLKSLGIYSLLLSAVSLAHKLEWQFAVLLIVTVVLLLPFIIYAQFSYTYEFQRFNDYCLYLKQMTIQYKTHKKIKSALLQTAQAFKENTSRMYSCILKAIQDIEDGEDFETALMHIERHYCNSYILKLHSYMVLGEQIGGDNVYQALNNVDFEDWQSDVVRFQKQKNNVKKTNIYFTLLSVSISLFCLYMFPQDLMKNLFSLTQFQLITFLYFEMLIIAYTLVTCGLNGKWISRKE